MKKTFPATMALLSTLLITALAVTLLMDISLADPFVVPPNWAEVKIQSPENKVYTETSIPVTFTIELVQYGNNEFVCTCFLDGRQIETQVAGGPYLYSGKATLLRLSEGEHRLKVSVNGNYYAYGSSGGYRVPFGGGSEVVFTVNAAEPRVQVLSPKPAKTYNTTTLPLNFTVSEPVSWLGYSLDGAAPVTITGNTTLSNLSEGTHTIVVQAEDTAGSTGASEPVTFKVETQTANQPTEPQSASFPVWLAVVTVVALLAGAILIAYFKKRKS